MSDKLPIAVISDTFINGYNWFQDKFEKDIREYVATHKMFIMRNGDKYIIVDDARQVYGREFSDFIRCPTYRSLLDEVVQRVK